MDFASIMRQLANVVNTLSFELALKKDDKEKHLSNAIMALNSCIDHLIALKNKQYPRRSPGNRRKEEV